MCQDCVNAMAESIFNSDDFRAKIVRDFEVQHICDGTFRFNNEVAGHFAGFLKQQADENEQWEEDTSDDEKDEIVKNVVCRLLDMIGDSQNHLAKFSFN